MPHDDRESDTIFYDQAVWYDILHEPGTDRDVDFLESINNRYGTGGRRWLEPACGTGRFLRVLAERGYDVTGYDLNERALRYARRQLQRKGLHAEVVHGDMTAFVRPGEFDFAFNTINTFRHLLDPSDALAHLRRTADSLKPGGLYVVGVDLANYDHPRPEEETWSVRRRGVCVKHLMMALPPTREQRRERILNYITVESRFRRFEFESHYDLLSYDREEWLELVDRSPFKMVATYTFSGTPISFGRHVRDINAVLMKV